MIKVIMQPGADAISKGESGIHTVIRKYSELLPSYGFEVVSEQVPDAELYAIHAGVRQGLKYPDKPVISHLHGLYWTGDYDTSENWQYDANRIIVETLRRSKMITVPSKWCARVIERDFRVRPRILPHGVDIDFWSSPAERMRKESYIISYAKNRSGVDVCDPTESYQLASQNTDKLFVSTFLPRKVGRPLPNVKVTGVMPYQQFADVVKNALVLINSTKETFGINALEAMVAGVPVLYANHGAIPDFIPHGVAGYGYKPGDLEDMQRGLDYCLAHREILSKNARLLGSAYTWNKAVAQVAELYAEAIESKGNGLYSIVIPFYNKSEADLTLALVSAASQNRTPSKIVVVDDGSPDPSVAVSAVETVKEAINGKISIELIRKENGGVAHARNLGVYNTDTEYVICLDADDRIEPGFAEECYKAFLDPAIGIAYTGLTTVSPSGETSLSKWPTTFEESKLVGRGARLNQVPTCCMFKREAWRRVGGYRQRYAPDGAGAEDIDFWFRLYNAGYGAKQVTARGLFLYSAWVGQVSGNKSYREVDWLANYGWHNTGDHPIASIVPPTNKKTSHPARSYDNPAVTFIVPCSPNHIWSLFNALDSIDGQSYKMWEVVVVMDGDKEHFPNMALDMLFNAYPYVNFIFAHGEKNGPGKCRNLGVEFATAELISFLDADDYLDSEFLTETIAAWNKSREAVYTDAMVVSPVKPSGPYVMYGSKYYMHTIKSAAYQCSKAAVQPEAGKEPYLWCSVNVLMPRAWHYDIGGFDEAMDSYEDVDYFWRMAQAGKCFTRVAKPLFFYNTETGTRRQEGLLKREELLEYMRGKYEPRKGVNDMCGPGCGNKGKNTNNGQTVTAFSKISSAARAAMSDENIVMVQYTSKNTGSHTVVGAATKNKYGYRKGGESFYVHRSDVAAQPHLFRIIEQVRETVVQPAAVSDNLTKTVELAPPKDLTTDYELKEMIGETPYELPGDHDVSFMAESGDQSTEEDRQMFLKLLDELGLRSNQVELLADRGITTMQTLRKSSKDELSAISGIGVKTVKKLVEVGGLD